MRARQHSGRRRRESTPQRRRAETAFVLRKALFVALVSKFTPSDADQASVAPMIWFVTAVTDAPEAPIKEQHPLLQVQRLGAVPPVRKRKVYPGPSNYFVLQYISTTYMYLHVRSGPHSTAEAPPLPTRAARLVATNLMNQ